MPLSLRTVTQSGPLTTSDYCVLANATTGPITLTFPPVLGLSGDAMLVKKTDATANIVSLVTLDGAPIIGDPVLINPGDRAVFATDGAAWHILQRLTANSFAPLSAGVPSDGVMGQVLTKTASGFAWGPPGTSDKTYTHIQLSASTSWTITHNLGRHPAVTIVDSAGTVVLGDVTYLSSNQVRLDFSAAFTGNAYLN